MIATDLRGVKAGSSWY